MHPGFDLYNSAIFETLHYLFRDNYLNLLKFLNNSRQPNYNISNSSSRNNMNEHFYNTFYMPALSCVTIFSACNAL